jgi:phenylacetate-CoA ligase
MISALFRHLLLPGFETGLKRRNTFRYLRELEQSEWMDADSLRQLQFTRLRSLLLHAQSQCLYYRKQWDRRGLAPAQLESLSDFSRWPLVDRDDVRAHRMEMRADNVSRWITKSTGGSTGTPVTFDLDLNSNDRRTAAWHRGYAWAAAPPGTRQFYLWGVDLRPRTRVQRFKESLWNRLHRKTVCNSFEMTHKCAPQIAARLARCRPHAIVAYVKPLYELARGLDEQGIQPYSPRSIVVGAEKLHSFERELIERVFRSPVFETYGSREFMLIAAECEQHRGLHITSEHLLVELLDDKDKPVEPGEEGNVVVTDLFNYGMPFIRYRTGDRAIASGRPCACGRGLPTLSRIVGRQLDIVRTPDGRIIPGEFFPHLMKDFRGVRAFQVVQQRIDSVTVQIVADAGFEVVAPALAATIQQQLGPGVRLSIERVENIPLTAAGKRRVVISQVPFSKAA